MAPITPRHPAAGTVTARGHAAISVYRLLRQLRTLSPEDRQYISALLAEELPPAQEETPVSDEHERAIFGLAFRPPSAQPHAWGDWQTLMGGHPAYVATHTQQHVCLECGAVQRRTVHAGTQAVISETPPQPFDDDNWYGNDDPNS